jgi:hypothetical protein
LILDFPHNINPKKLGQGGDQKKSSVIHTKDFCEKNVPKSPDFDEFFSEINILRK